MQQTCPSKKDIYRAWYEENYNGSLSKSNPYQAALCSIPLAHAVDLEKSITNVSVDYALSGLNHYGELYSSKLAHEGCSRFVDEETDQVSESDSELVMLFAANMAALQLTPDRCSTSSDVEIGLSLAADLVVASMSPQPSSQLPPSHDQSMTNKTLGDEVSNTDSKITSKSSANGDDKTNIGSTSRSRPIAPIFAQTVQRDERQTYPLASSSVSTLAPASDEQSGGLSKRFKSAKQEFVAQGGSVNSLAKGTKPALGMSKVSNNSSSSSGSGNGRSSSGGSGGDKDKEDLPPELQQFERALVERVEADIIASGQNAKTSFEDIAGLDFAKKCVQEVICWPMLRPDLFTGLRALPKGVLLFGPPGTGKTLIGKAIAHQVGATFFSISASSLTSKWIGEGERLVRTLFGVANYRQPAIIFIDEVDSLLSSRSEGEAEASRRMKTEFLVQLDGAGTDDSAQVIILGATNRPDELDDAARRRFVKRIYVPLPDMAARRQMVYTLLGTAGQKVGSVDSCGKRSAIYHQLTEEDVTSLVSKTAGYSGADIRNLCTEAAMGPVREISTLHGNNLGNISVNEFPPIVFSPHIEEALNAVSATVSVSDLRRYIEWNESFGTYKKLQIGIDE